MNNQKEASFNSTTDSNHGNNTIIKGDEFLNDLLKGTGSRSIEIRKIERELETAEDRLSTVNTSSSNKTEQIKLGFKKDSNGNELRLSFSEKTKLKKEQRILKSTKRTLTTEVSQLSKKYSTLCKLEANNEKRAAIRKTAGKDSYHVKNSAAIKTAITTWATVMNPEKFATLKIDIAEATEARADASIMKALLKAPRNLHTKVVANSTNRSEYLAHLKEQLV